LQKSRELKLSLAKLQKKIDFIPQNSTFEKNIFDFFKKTLFQQKSIAVVDSRDHLIYNIIS
jgi:hypothetical protein